MDTPLSKGWSLTLFPLSVAGFSGSHVDSMYLLTSCSENCASSLWCSSPKSIIKSNGEKTSGEFKWKNILKHAFPETLKSGEIMENKERVKNSKFINVFPFTLSRQHNLSKRVYTAFWFSDQIQMICLLIRRVTSTNVATSTNPR